jgi:hypothetical protein
MLSSSSRPARVFGEKKGSDDQPTRRPDGSDLDVSPRFAFDARRWTGHEVITVGLSLALLFMLPRPWYDVRIATSCNSQRSVCTYRNLGSAAGTDAHGFLWLAVLPVLVIVAVLVLRALRRTPFPPWLNDRQLLAGAACANVIIVVAAFLIKSSRVSGHGSGDIMLSIPPSYSIRWESAAYTALAIAAVAALSAILNLTGPRTRINILVGLAVVTGLAVAATSIAVAISIHQPLTYLPECIRAPCPKPPGYPVALRATIAAGGFLAAGLLIAIGRHAHRHRR